MVLVMSISPLFLFAFELWNLNIIVLGNLMTQIVTIFKLYNSTLTECTNLIVKLHLEDTTCIAILPGKIQNAKCTFGHIPRKIPCYCYFFLEEGGNIT